jgi:hypothetical protein
VRSLLLVLLACSHPPAQGPQGDGEHGLITHSSLAEDDGDKPSYGRPELDKALITERGAEAAQEKQIAELEAKDADDALRVARADLDVRRRFIASLEACRALGRVCPPRLDDPPWTFDIEGDDDPKLDVAVSAPGGYGRSDWQKVAAELHGRACVCRTMACVDGVEVAIARLEGKPAPAVRGDEVASASITRARECLWRLRGKGATPRPPEP